MVLKSYIDGLPVELDEAAMVDGANEFQVFYKIIIPLAMPQLAVIFLFSFIATYSEYVITSAFSQKPGKMTLALGYSHLSVISLQRIGRYFQQQLLYLHCRS